jgi:hypothetical protein
MSQKQNQSLVNKNYNNANKTDRRRNDIKNVIATGYGSETAKHANKSITDQSDSETSLEYSSSDESHGELTSETDATAQIKEQNKMGLAVTWKNFFKQKRAQEKKNHNETQITTNTKILYQANLIQTDKQELNISFGHLIKTSTEYECFLFHNINGLKDEHNWTQINSVMKDLDITCMGFAEINNTMNGINYQKWNAITCTML